MKRRMLVLMFAIGSLAVPSRSHAQLYAGDGTWVASAIVYGPPILAAHILSAVNLGQVVGSRTYFDDAGAIAELVFSSVGLVGLMTPFLAFDAADGMPAWMLAIAASSVMSFTWNITHAILSLTMPRAAPFPVKVAMGPSGIQLSGQF